MASVLANVLGFCSVQLTDIIMGDKFILHVGGSKIGLASWQDKFPQLVLFQERLNNHRSFSLP